MRFTEDEHSKFARDTTSLSFFQLDANKLKIIKKYKRIRNAQCLHVTNTY
jgi:hypothetical protein